MNASVQNDRPQSRNSWGMLLPILATIMLLATIGFLYLQPAFEWFFFRRELAPIQATVDSWRLRRPAEVDALQWRWANDWAGIGVGNVCFSPSHVSLAEMRRLRQDVEQANQQPITLETYDWLWARLAETGPKGADYIQRMSLLRDENLGRNVDE